MSPWVMALLGCAAFEALGALWFWWETRRAIDPPADIERGVGR